MFNIFKKTEDYEEDYDAFANCIVNNTITNTYDEYVSCAFRQYREFEEEFSQLGQEDFFDKYGLDEGDLFLKNFHLKDKNLIVDLERIPYSTECAISQYFTVKDNEGRKIFVDLDMNLLQDKVEQLEYEKLATLLQDSSEENIGESNVTKNIKYLSSALDEYEHLLATVSVTSWDDFCSYLHLDSSKENLNIQKGNMLVTISHNANVPYLIPTISVLGKDNKPLIEDLDIEKLNSARAKIEDKVEGMSL